MATAASKANWLIEAKSGAMSGKKTNGSSCNLSDQSFPEKRVRSASVVTFASEEDKRHIANNESFILGASRAAREGFISRTAINNQVPPNSRHNMQTVHAIPVPKQQSKTAKRGGEFEKDEIKPKDNENYFSVQQTHAKLLEALDKIYEPKKNLGVLGASASAYEGIARRMSRSIEITSDATTDRGTLESAGTTTTYVESHEGNQKPATGDLGTKRGKWKPEGCPLRYAKLFPLPAMRQEKKVEIAIQPAAEKAPEVHFEAVPNPWCGCCMRESFDPLRLPCGHSFCRRCIVDTNFFLLRDNKEAVQDTRAVMRCPLRHCKAVIRCLPLINGDFRFHLVRPEDKVQLKEPKLNLCEQHRLTTYKIRMDVDVTTRKSDDLFDGFNDVVIIP